MVARHRAHRLALWPAAVAAVALDLVGRAAPAPASSPPAAHRRVRWPGQEGGRLDPYRPGRSLHRATLHVPQGAQLAWEAWRPAGAPPLRLHSSSPAVRAAQVQLRADVGGLSLVRVAVAVDPEAPVDALVAVQVDGGAEPLALAGEQHDQRFALTVHVVRAARYAGL